MGSFYDVMRRYKMDCALLLPMLGRPWHKYPRFRDCYSDPEHGRIIICTRVGSANMNTGCGEEALFEDPNFDEMWDGELDNTYGYYAFKVPEKWKADFNWCISGSYCRVSDEFVHLIIRAYPDSVEEVLDLLRGQGIKGRIQEIRSFLARLGSNCKPDMAELIVLLEKSLPIPVTLCEDGKFPRCPRCKEDLINSESMVNYCHYCPECGQALDWNDYSDPFASPKKP